MLKSARSAPQPQPHIDAIDQRVAQLHGLCGVLRSLSSNQEASIFPDDLANIAWLVDDLLDEIGDQANRLYRNCLAHKGCGDGV